MEDITKDRFVAMLDIMGFRSIIKNQTHKEIYQLFVEIDAKIRIAKNIKSKVEISTFSDTIILISQDDSFDCYRDLINAVARFMVTILEKGYGINGAVAYGSVTLDIEKNILFGQPIVDAYELQNDLFFYGVVLHDTAKTKLHAIASLHKAHLDLMIPLKSKGWQKYSCFNWQYLAKIYTKNIETDREGGDLSIAREIMTRLYEDNKDVQRGFFYLQNTETVLKYWFDTVSEENDGQGWGELLSEKYINEARVTAEVE